MERRPESVALQIVRAKQIRKERFLTRGGMLKVFLKEQPEHEGVTPLASAHFAVKARVGGSGGRAGKLGEK